MDPLAMGSETRQASLLPRTCSQHDLQVLIDRGRRLGLSDHALGSALRLTGEELSRIERGAETGELNALLTIWEARIHPRVVADIPAVLRQVAATAQGETDRARAADDGSTSR